MSSIRLRPSAVLGALPAVLAGATVVAVIQMSPVENHLASVSTVTEAAGVRLADNDDDQAQAQQQYDQDENDAAQQEFNQGIQDAQTTENNTDLPVYNNTG